MLSKIKGKTMSNFIFYLRKKFSWLISKWVYGRFGKDSIIQKPILIYNKKNIFIGNNVTIRSGLRIEPIKNYGSQVFHPKIIIGDGTSIEQNCHITCANVIEIGKYVTIAGYSMITDIDHEYRDISRGILQQDLIVKRTQIGDQTFIGMGARIMPGVNVGKHCIIGANSVVTKDLPDFSVAVGIPAKVIKRYDIDTKSWRKTSHKGDFE